jgi:guanylate kinase
MAADTGNLFVIAAPSGTGKTSLVKAVAESMQGITVSISHTTRPKRPGEEDALNYYFVDKEQFQRMIKHHDFLEYASIFDNYYGTSKSWVSQTLAQGMDVILEIDWQGHQQIKQLFPLSIGIFILPPSMNALQDRLTKRNQDTAEVIKKRLADAKETISHVHEFNYLVINDDFATAQHELKTIVEASRLLQKRQAGKHARLIADLKRM